MMSTKWMLMALALAVAVTVPVPAGANHLAAPTNPTCSSDGSNLTVDWDDTVGATKYSVNVIAGYDTGGDTVVDTSVEFDFGTGDRTDGNPRSQSDLTIPLSALVVDANSDGVLDSPVQVDVRVKGLHPGKSQGRQNNPWSALTSCTGAATP